MTFSSIDEARAAQTRASISQSHAIHAAVVDHEAKTLMRRSTLALAHDVKVWNVHRKRETLQACVAYSRSQHEATRRAVDAWSSLRDGFIGTTTIPSAPDRRSSAISTPPSPPVPSVPTPRSPAAARRDKTRAPASLEANEVTATIFTDRVSDGEGASSAAAAAIVAVDHHALSPGGIAAADIFHDATEEPSKDVFDLFESCSHSASVAPGDALPPSHDLLIHPFATADPIPEGDDEDNEAASVGGSGTLSSGRGAKSQHRSSSLSERDPDASAGSAMSASMQSLIDGLMMWGGGAGGGGGGVPLGCEVDTEDDHFALPVGMAASIAFGERTRAQSSASDSTPPLS
jgi:hypothetical protein